MKTSRGRPFRDEAERLTDAQWGYGWIGWASGYQPPPRTDAPTDHRRAVDLLRQGYAVNGVRDRDAVAEWLALARKKSES